MGNITTFDQLPSPLRSLNEDNMVVLLQYLDVADYVHLTATCRKFLHETLGPNNYFWAQLLNRSWQPVESYSSMPYSPPPPPSLPTQPTVVNSPTPTQRLVNHVLQTTRNGRKFEVDGKPLDLTIPLDTLNKKLVGHFDFRNEIKMYFFKAKWAPALSTQLQSYIQWTNARADVRIEETIKPQDYFVKPTQIQPNELVSDVTFVVDLGVDATSLENIKKKQLFNMFKLRRVVYEKRNVPAMDYSKLMSRSRMAAPAHYMQQQQPQLIPQPVGGPGIPGGPLNALPKPTYQPNSQFHLPPLPPQPQPRPQIGLRPVQPPPIIAANGPTSTPQQLQQQQQQYRK